MASNQTRFFLVHGESEGFNWKMDWTLLNQLNIIIAATLVKSQTGNPQMASNTTHALRPHLSLLQTYTKTMPHAAGGPPIPRTCVDSEMLNQSMYVFSGLKRQRGLCGDTHTGRDSLRLRYTLHTPAAEYYLHGLVLTPAHPVPETALPWLHSLAW